MAKRIGLIGCGNWGRNILRDLRTLGCEVHVAVPSPTGRANAEAGGATRIVERLSELAEIDAAVVATPTSAHYHVLCELLESRPHISVFCEKPLTADVNQAERLVQRWPDRIFVMDKWRYHRGIQKLKQIVVSGELGTIHGLRTVRVAWGESHTDVEPAWTLAPHDLSIALEIFGRVPEPIAARSDGAGGLIALLGDRPWMSLEVSARRLDVTREFQLYGSEGVAVMIDGQATSLQVARSDAKMTIRKPVIEERPIEQEMPLLAELRAFVGYVRNEGPPPKSTAAEGLEVVRAIHKLRLLAGLVA